MPFLRYAILHHTTADGAHYDVMIEASPVDPLLTWRVAEWPIVEPTPATRLPDHRRAYLTYEGTISGNRGTVKRVEGGEAVIEFNGGDQIVLRGTEGTLRIEHVREKDWIIAPAV